jgi:hypothetical protein
MDLQHSLRAHPYILRSGLTLQVLCDIPGIAQAAVITGIYSRYHTNTVPVRYCRTRSTLLLMQYHTTIVLYWYHATSGAEAHKNISPRTDSLTFAPRTALIRHPPQHQLSTRAKRRPGQPCPTLSAIITSADRWNTVAVPH